MLIQKISNEDGTLSMDTPNKTIVKKKYHIWGVDIKREQWILLYRQYNDCRPIHVIKIMIFIFTEIHKYLFL